jgi:hypothetical protein
MTDNALVHYEILDGPGNYFIIIIQSYVNYLKY